MEGKIEMDKPTAQEIVFALSCNGWQSYKCDECYYKAHRACGHCQSYAKADAVELIEGGNYA